MTLAELRSLVREYVDDVPGVAGEMYGDPELDRAINESQRSLGAAMQAIEPAILSEHTTLVTSATHDDELVFPGTVDEYLLPTDFRKLVALVRMSAEEGVALGDPILAEVVPFHSYSLNARYDVYELDAAYCRDYTLDEFEGWIAANNRLLELDGSVFSGIKNRLRRSVIGFQRWAVGHVNEGATQPVSVEYEIHYHAVPDKLEHDTDVSNLPSEHHELLAVDAAMRVLGHDNSEMVGVDMVHEHLMESMKVILPDVVGAEAEVV